MKRIISVFCLAFLFITTYTSCAPAAARYQYADTAMGTIMQFNLYAGSEDSANAFAETATDMLTQLEEELLSWRLETSEIYRINAVAGSGQATALSEKMVSILTECLDMWEASEGAFDITLGELTRLWQIDAVAAGEVEKGTYRVPSAEEIANALSHCGSDKLNMDSTGATIVVLADMQLDLGAVGKGVALDEISILLSNYPDITGAVISAGGSVLVYGTKPDSSSWNVGIVNPFDTSATIGTLTLEGSGWFVTTSGDYERYVEVDGVRYHHILDPATGYPVQNNVRAVTVLTKKGQTGDMLSTACYVLGVEEGMKLASKYNAEILFVLSDGSVKMSQGMEQYFHSNE